jgi:hypothetical protein
MGVRKGATLSLDIRGVHEDWKGFSHECEVLWTSWRCTCWARRTYWVETKDQQSLSLCPSSAGL